MFSYVKKIVIERCFFFLSVLYIPLYQNTSNFLVAVPSCRYIKETIFRLGRCRDKMKQRVQTSSFFPSLSFFLKKGCRMLVEVDRFEVLSKEGTFLLKKSMRHERAGFFPRFSLCLPIQVEKYLQFELPFFFFGFSSIENVLFFLFYLESVLNRENHPIVKR